MSERPRDEKEEKDEKGREESWDEKWRRDPLTAAGWALVLIWAGLVLIANNLITPPPSWEAWPVIFIGAGVIVLLGVLIRLVVPAYRRPVTGSIIFGFILLGIGLSQLPEMTEKAVGVIGALVLIAIGVSIFLSRLVRRE
jgi:hypothetical protein